MQAIPKRSGIELHQYNSDHTFGLPLTATYIIDKKGTVIAGASDLSHRARMEPSEALKKSVLCNNVIAKNANDFTNIILEDRYIR
ncbi:hypothetical protein ACIFOT_00815 [Neobacillus sp. NRS-1170]|uniref:hypothetical protein n=1 Tax=Neobacillus sp. NRS-1170 TaxID=3233898 RepID=UPI003D2AC0A0